MGKKAKEKTTDLLYLEQNNKKRKNADKKQKKNKINDSKKKGTEQKENLKDTKEKTFDFSEEIVIGLKRLDDEPKVNTKKRENTKKKHKSKSKVQEEEILPTDIYSKQNKEKTQESKGKKKQYKNKKPIKKLTPKQELAKKKRKAIFKLIKGTTLIGIIIGGTIFFFLSPIFNIKNITVEGNKKISSDEIISLSHINIEQNMFQYRMKEIQEEIKQNAYIQKVDIRRKLPDTIEILVSERKATYMIQIANAYAYIDNQGYVLEITDKKEILPLLEGIATIQENIHPGNRLDTEDLKKLNDVLKIMESANSNGIINFITKIDITNEGDYILRLEEKKKTVHLGDISNLSTKMLWIIKFNEEEKKTPGDIYLNMNLNNESNKPFFRKKI